MAIRVVKHLGSRNTVKDDVKVLMLVPLFPGESIAKARLSAYFASGANSAIDEPGELNWYGISVPWQVLFTLNMVTTNSINTMGAVSDFDAFFKQVMLGGDDEYYGGDVDKDVEEISGEEAHDTTGTSAEELLDSGPIGIHKWFSREVIMAPFASEGVNTIRFGDSFEAVISKIPNAAMGSLLMFGIVRFEVDVDTNFNVELDDAISKEAMGLLINGDYTKIKAIVEGDSGTRGDFVRTVLYGGDNYIETDTLKGPVGAAHVKAAFTINTPLGRRHG